MFRRLGRFTAILAAVLTIALATMAVATVAAGAASSKFKSTTTLAIGPQGTLVSPPGVAITLKYSCFPFGPGAKGGYGYGGGAFGDVRVTDVSGNTGFGFFTPTCNDTNQTAVIIVSGFFNRGDAAANAFICGFDCNSTSREIKIS
jgi:hypothetical protein